MSGILGIWNLDGRPADRDTLNRMSGTLRHRGSDGEGQRVAASAAFACQHHWVTREELGETQPLTGSTGAMLVMDGRIDNRDELLHELKLPRTASDATCALAAFEAWGEAFPDHLNGDFALAVFDEARQQLLLARDALGMRPLYYFTTGQTFGFASEIKALLGHPAVETKPDSEGVADFLLMSSRPLDRQEITCFAGILAVEPAHLVRVTRERTVARRYWDFETGTAIRLGSFE